MSSRTMNRRRRAALIPPERLRPAVVRWRATVVTVWLLTTGSIAAYALLKPGTSAGDLVFLPDGCANWLDAYYNFRTFLMTVSIGSIPSFPFLSRRNDLKRRSALGALPAFLAALEIFPFLIPSRGFGWQDLTYTIAGVLVCDVFA